VDLDEPLEDKFGNTADSKIIAGRCLLSCLAFRTIGFFPCFKDKNGYGIINILQPVPKGNHSMVSFQEIAELSRQIAAGFQPEKIILFGSYAYGIPDNDSDVDLLVILSFQGKPFRKSLEILNKTNPKFPVDLIARKPDEAMKRYAEGDPLIREALNKGKILYEQRN